MDSDFDVFGLIQALTAHRSKRPEYSMKMARCLVHLD